MSLKTRIEELATRIATELKSVKSKVSGNNSGDLSGLNTAVKTSILAAINELVSSVAGKQSSLGFTPENLANKGAANGYASLDGTGKVPANQLPAFVDDILEFINLAAFPTNGTSGILYVAIDENKTYRWSGTGYVATNGALALGETSATAHRGDHGKTAFDHSQETGNPHGVTFANLGSKPTTIEGFGISDAYSKTEIGNPDTNFVAVFESALL